MSWMTPEELCRCMQAGWRLRLLPREISGYTRKRDLVSFGFREHGRIRDLWLGVFNSDENKDLGLEEAAMLAEEEGLIRPRPEPVTRVIDYFLTEAGQCVTG